MTYNSRNHLTQPWPLSSRNAETDRPLLQREPPFWEEQDQQPTQVNKTCFLKVASPSAQAT